MTFNRFITRYVCGVTVTSVTQVVPHHTAGCRGEVHPPFIQHWSQMHDACCMWTTHLCDRSLRWCLCSGEHGVDMLRCFCVVESAVLTCWVGLGRQGTSCLLSQTCAAQPPLSLLSRSKVRCCSIYIHDGYVLPCTLYSLHPVLFSCPGQRNRRRPVPVPTTGVRYNSLL